MKAVLNPNPPFIKKRDRKQTCLIVGGGLAGGLAALQLQKKDPQSDIQLFDQAPLQAQTPRTWSFHETDLTPQGFELVQPFLGKTWPGYEVQFRGFHRTLNSPYHSIHSHAFYDFLKKKLKTHFIFDQEVVSVAPQQITFKNGDSLTADCVLDARGISLPLPYAAGFQKFLGLQLELKKPHGLSLPLLMDGTLPQEGDFRFMYILPWSSTHLLVEETSYSDSPLLDRGERKKRILSYVLEHYGNVQTFLGEEQGVLPIPLENPVPRRPFPVPKIGVAAGFFHDVTGYSLPFAVEIALALGELPSLSPHAVQTALSSFHQKKAGFRKFLRVFNHFLFKACPPSERHTMLHYFYKLPEPLIQRFYAGTLRGRDAFQLFTGGRPPVSIHQAILALLKRPSLWKGISHD